MSGSDIGALIAAGITVLFTVVTVIASVLVALLSALVPLGIMILVFRAIAKQQEASRELMRTGIPARAVVQSLGETGITINNQPQLSIGLEVHPPEGDPYLVSMSRVTSILEIPRLQPGAEVAVVIDRKNPRNLVLDLARPVPSRRTCAFCHRAIPAEAAACPGCGAGA